MTKTAALAVLFCLVAAAQIPPPLLRVTRMPGSGTLFTPFQYGGARAEVDVLGIRAATGLPETWTIEMHQTFASIEDLDAALVGVRSLPMPEPGVCADEVLGSARTMIAYYRAGWGYRSEEAVRMLPRARYLHVAIYRMRPGGDDQLEKLLAARRRRMETVNLDHPDLVYHVVSGGQSGLYIVLAPIVSLRKFDEGVAKLPAWAEPMAAAETPAELDSAESLLFRMDPGISYVTAEFAAADPGFWHP
ncbi:MAG: hypothetical protein WBL61_12585 [Bryobacteraceae bacterium]